MAATALQVIKPSHPEWKKMWKSLAEKVGDAIEPCECCGEVWQYMDSVMDGHEFRHRCHPKSHTRIYVLIPWSK